MRAITAAAHETSKRPHVVVDADGCWVWATRSCDRASPYSPDGTAAHRWFYRRFKGEIADGLVVVRNCGYRECVNPDHLEAITRSESCIRAWKRRLGTDESE